MPSIATITTRDQPYVGQVIERRQLTPTDSEKRTFHIVLDIAGSNIQYAPGDCVAVLPDNPPERVVPALARIGAHGDERVIDRRTDEELSLRSFLTLRANLDRETPALRRHIGNNPQSFADAHARLLPRFFSIASSMTAVGEEIHLTVRQVGLCTDFLCHRVVLGERMVPLYIQPGRHFALPEDDSSSLIMIGPGTGIAPYRAFLQERRSRGASGDHWLFFGEWTEAGHFFYREEWESWGTRVTTAFSRDQPDKVYVQHRLEAAADEIWRWLEDGAYLYLCGDAKRMAPAVETTLKNIFYSHGIADPAAYLREMRRERRYRRDVY